MFVDHTDAGRTECSDISEGLSTILNRLSYDIRVVVVIAEFTLSLSRDRTT